MRVFNVWHFCCLVQCSYTLNILSFYSVFFFLSYIVVILGWLACLRWEALHSGTNLLFGISLSWAVFLHLIILSFCIVLSFYPYALLTMLGGFAGLFHGGLHSVTVFLYTSIILSLIRYFPQNYHYLSVLDSFANKVVSMVQSEGVIMLTVLGLVQNTSIYTKVQQ